MSSSQPASQPDSIDLAYDMWAGQFEFVGSSNQTTTSGNNNTNKSILNNNTNSNNNNNYNSCSIHFGDKNDINSSHRKSTESLEDLNLNFNTTASTTTQNSLNSSLSSNSTYRFGDFNGESNYIFGKQPILIEQEPFLSLNPGDFDDIVPSGPNSLVFIENKLSETTSTTTDNDSDTENIITNNNNNNNNNNSIIINPNNNNNNNNKIVNLESLTNKFNNNKTNNTNTNGFKLENLKNFKNKLIGNLEEKSNSCVGVGVVVVGGSVDENDEMQPHNNENNGFHVNGKMHEIAAEICENFNEQLELLQRQVTDLADTQTISEDRTSRTKTEYAVLQARYHMLEEQCRETELRAEERLLEEQKRHREMVTRVEREAALQAENCHIKVHTIENEAKSLREENQRLRVLCDKQANDLHRMEEKLELAQDQIAALQHDLSEAKQLERKYEDEKKATEELMLELSKELERLRAETGPAMPTTSPETIRLEELHQELEEMRQKNKALEEQNEELQAAVLTRGVEEGRHLLNGTLNSLAQELEEMSQTQASEDSITLASFNELKKGFQEKEEENTRMRHYIDTILLNIVENYPHLLEVKPTPATGK